MPKGSCQCGDFAYQFSGEADITLACHCLPCRKTTGTTGSYNLIVPTANFTVTKGIPKKWSRIGDSGKSVTYNNCPICSTLLFVEAEQLPDKMIVKLGTVDDKAYVESVGTPASEIYCKNMVGWEKPWEGAQTVQGAS
ncbi:hypothetical protein K461DRAFT_7905 [Myriangium duriaei CBS 260.36]|uniref:CENP-V/GFA domain-containing protein n=1 Tax=Myriangium duriaei CBS 260.36 TaxID=1168546 RepID=A0A9P4ML53_9PEZI|nr:hypothetical protein K461DRAFT_7905 [Myriangium duriaei CBS 260.36]